MATECCEHCREHLDPIYHVPRPPSEYMRAVIDHMKSHPWSPAIHIVGGPEGPMPWKIVPDLELIYTRWFRMRWVRGAHVDGNSLRFRLGRLEGSLDPISKKDWHQRARKPRWWRRG